MPRLSHPHSLAASAPKPDRGRPAIVKLLMMGKLRLLVISPSRVVPHCSNMLLQIQESVLGDDHKVVASTQESIAFVKTKEEQVGSADDASLLFAVTCLH